MDRSIILDPLLPWPVIAAAAALALAAAALALARGLPGWWLRALAGAAVVAALLGPSLQTEAREALTDIVLVLEDGTASSRIGERAAQTAEAASAMAERIAERPNTEVRRVAVPDGEGDAGTLLMRALSDALSEEPRARVAGVVAVTDGRLHDPEAAPELPAPFHVLLTGSEEDWDRRLSVLGAPAFAILDEEVMLTVRIDDEGDAPREGAAPGAETAPLTISVDGGEPMAFEVPVGEDLELPVTLPHGGRNVIRFETPEAEGELTARNNAAVIQMNGVRDRLRVLLVSGEPHPGERTWRNLLKSDSAVDLVHFTILRPPEKQDGVPVDELSLIAFPTRELFLDKIDEFDLIVFDRYKRRGILPGVYLDNIRRYVEDGGAVLVAAGPDYASADSLARSPLGDALPALPTGRVIEEGFTPLVTELGERHPVTRGLAAFAPEEGEGAAGEDGAPAWGRWFRTVEVEATEGATVMTGAGERPLLVLAREGEGRVALMASDHAWLWSRGFEGGGPQLELLRRLAHWLMKEPELEEEALTAETDGATITVTRRTLAEEVGTVTLTAPDGAQTTLTLREEAPGLFRGEIPADQMGLWRLTDGERETVIGVGPAAPREFERTIAGAEALEPLVEATRGGVVRVEDGLPAVRDVRPGRDASGRGWIGITPREAHLTTDVSVAALLPPWAYLLIAGALMVGAWLREGRRG